MHTHVHTHTGLARSSKFSSSSHIDESPGDMYDLPLLSPLLYDDPSQSHDYKG